LYSHSHSPTSLSHSQQSDSWDRLHCHSRCDYLHFRSCSHCHYCLAYPGYTYSATQTSTSCSASAVAGRRLHHWIA
jgi:hypothetical protein